MLRWPLRADAFGGGSDISVLTKTGGVFRLAGVRE